MDTSFEFEEIGKGKFNKLVFWLFLVCMAGILTITVFFRKEKTDGDLNNG